MPVTEYGDPDGWFGYRFRDRSGELSYRAALAIDISEWDDPDYQFLAFAGRDRPFSEARVRERARRRCSEPGRGDGHPGQGGGASVGEGVEGDASDGGVGEGGPEATSPRR